MTNITEKEFEAWCVENDVKDTFSIMPNPPTDPNHYVGGFIDGDKYTFILVEG